MLINISLMAGAVSASSLRGHDNQSLIIPLGKYKGTTVGSGEFTGLTRLALTFKSSDSVDFSFSSDLSIYGSAEPLEGACEDVNYEVESTSDTSYAVLIGSGNECMQRLVENWNSQIEGSAKIVELPFRFSFSEGGLHLESRESFGYALNVNRVGEEEIELQDLSVALSGEKDDALASEVEAIAVTNGDESREEDHNNEGSEEIPKSETKSEDVDENEDSTSGSDHASEAMNEEDRGEVLSRADGIQDQLAEAESSDVVELSNLDRTNGERDDDDGSDNDATNEDDGGEVLPTTDENQGGLAEAESSDVRDVTSADQANAEAGDEEDSDSEENASDSDVDSVTSQEATRGNNQVDHVVADGNADSEEDQTSAPLEAADITGSQDEDSHAMEENPEDIQDDSFAPAETVEETFGETRHDLSENEENSD
jgi:hypothetical protein